MNTNNNPLASAYEQHNSTFMSEKLPGIDTLPTLEESTACFNDKEQQISYLPQKNTLYSLNGIQNSFYTDDLSPPLTPAVSPSSVLMDSMQYKRKFSIDVGPFGFGSNISNPSMNDQDAFRRSSCSAMDDSNDYSVANNSVAINARPFHQSNDFYMNNNNAIQFFDNNSSKMESTSPTKRRGSRANLNGPSKPHKHACWKPFCNWSFKRYEHLKRHMLTHSGARPFNCEVPQCGKTFSRSDNYNAHRRTHDKKLKQQQQQLSGAPSMTKKLSSNASTIAAAAVAATAAVVASVSTSGSNMTTAPQIFDDRAQNNFFKQPFDMTYEMYGHHHHHHHHHAHHHRSVFPPTAEETNNDFGALRNFNQPNFGMHPSLLNHEVHSQPFFTSEPGYSINPLVSESPSSGYREAYGYPSYTMTALSTPAVHETSSNNNNNSNKSNTGMMSISPVTNNASAVNEVERRESLSNQKTHICPSCQRSFKRLEHLKRHMRIHSQEKPYVCDFPNCHKRFSRTDNLSQHTKTHQRTEDRRRRQQPSQDFTMNKPQDNSPSNDTMLNNMVGVSWHSANTGTVGC